MYPALLLLHSWLRWLVLVLAVLAVVRALIGRLGRHTWTSADDSAGRFFVAILDLQVLIGLLLAFVFSPITATVWGRMAEAMANPALRFISVEHLVGMLVAAALAHVGRVRVRKASGSAERHTRALVFFGLSLFVMLISIPWPFMAAARPLFRGL